MTETTAGEVVLDLDLQQRPRDEAVSRVLGLNPYVLLEPGTITDEAMSVHVEAGGGARLLDIADFLEAIADGLRDPALIQAVTAAETADQETSND